MAQHDFNRRSALEDLISRAESLNTEQQRIVEVRRTVATREVEEAEINVNTYQSQLQGYVHTTICYK
jgi:hypothetical protein